MDTVNGPGLGDRLPIGPSAAGLFRPPEPFNEPVRAFVAGSAERASLEGRLLEFKRQRLEIPLIIGGEDVRTGATRDALVPHDKRHVLAEVHQAGESEIHRAIQAAERARRDWSRFPWEERAAVFLRAAELLAGPWRETVTAATMLGQSKTAYEADADTAELVDFLRFNVAFMVRMYEEQPQSTRGAFNRIEYRPLEGFVLAVSPFNFTAIGGNLTTSAALLGNTVLWKPASTAMVSAFFVMRALQEAGLPDGVINLVYSSGETIGRTALVDPSLAGVHFTGSTDVFQEMWEVVGRNVRGYRNYPRLVGETGGKDFILVHSSADADAVTTAILRGSFEYQGQKCSAASRIFVASNLWPRIREQLADEVATLRTGDVADLSNFMGAVIDDRSFATQRRAISEARSHADTNVVAGGGTDDSVGYFVEPTVIETSDPHVRLMRDELFGPIVTVFAYRDDEFVDVLRLIDEETPYALTGSIFANDRRALMVASERLRYAAGNLYLNDKPTGAVIGSQPFGGSRGSGTNDKAGSMWNLIRWVSPRTIKERFVPPCDYRFPFMESDSGSSEDQGRTR